MTAAQQTKEQQEDGLLPRQARLGFGPASKLPVDPLERIRRAQRLPLQLRKAEKGEEIIAGLVQAFHDGWTAQAPLLRESGARLFHGGPALSVDHPAIVLGEFLAQTDRRLGLKVSQLVCRATLNRQRRPLLTQRGRQAGAPIDHRESRRAHVALDETANHLAPGGRTLIAGEAEIQHDPLAIGAHAERHEVLIAPPSEEPHPARDREDKRRCAKRLLSWAAF
jgi:hypothetical protein